MFGIAVDRSILPHTQLPSFLNLAFIPDVMHIRRTLLLRFRSDVTFFVPACRKTHTTHSLTHEVLQHLMIISLKINWKQVKDTKGISNL